MRSTEEWIGRNDDDGPPPRVRLRVFERNAGRCYICTRQIRAGEYWEADHVIALCNGGENRERNLRPICRNCCKSKTAIDVAEKSKVAHIRSKHLGIRRTSRPMDGSRKSRWKKKMSGEVVARDRICAGGEE